MRPYISFMEPLIAPACVTPYEDSLTCLIKPVLVSLKNPKPYKRVLAEPFYGALLTISFQVLAPVSGNEIPLPAPGM